MKGHTQTKTNTQRHRLIKGGRYTIYIISSSLYLAATMGRLVQLVEGKEFTILLALLFQLLNTILIIAAIYTIEKTDSFYISHRTYKRIMRIIDVIDYIIKVIKRIILLPLLIVAAILKIAIKTLQN